MTLDTLLCEIRACDRCAMHLRFGPRPTLSVFPGARVLIVGQAPGTRVHETGIPWNDRSGDRLRAWLGMSRADFYESGRIAIMPMGFCYPGVDARGGDLPPRPECAPLWHDRVLAEMGALRLTLLVGQYAQKRYLGPGRGRTLTETVARFADYLPQGFMPLPHPSWRTTGWQKKHPWFDARLLPALRRAVEEALA